MSRRDGTAGLLVGAVAGALVGAWGGWTLGRSAPTSTPPQVAAAASMAPASAPAPVCPPCADEAPADAAAADVETVVAAQDAQIRGLSDVAFGRPLIWPDPAQVADLQQEIRETLAECAPHVKLLASDCSEPPCLVSLDLGEDDTSELDEACPTLQARLTMKGYYGTQKKCPDGSLRNFVVLDLGHTNTYRDANQVEGLDFAENERTRVRIRTKDLQSDLACE